MKRLTERDEFGNANIIGLESAALQQDLDFEAFNRVTAALNRLADYEEKTGLLPEEAAARIEAAPPLCPADCRWWRMGRYQKCTGCIQSVNRRDNYEPERPSDGEAKAT